MGKDVIIACDFADKKTCLDFLDGFKGRKPFVKIGMELFYAEGPEIVREGIRYSLTSSCTISRIPSKSQWRCSRGSTSICVISMLRGRAI